MIKRQLGIALVSLFALATLAFVGCSTSDNPADGNDLIVGDLNDASFVGVSEFIQDEDLDDAFTISAEISFDLMEEQFGEFGNPGTSSRGGSTALASGADSSIFAIGTYTYENGWHIFGFEAVLYTMDDTLATLNGTDSIRIAFQDVPIQEPDSTSEIDSYLIRAHFVWNGFGQMVSTFTGHHSVDLAADYDAVPPTVTVDASVGQGHTSEFTIHPETDSMATCEINLSFDQTVTDLVFLMDEEGEPGECPVSGSIFMMAGIDLLCGGATSGDTLEVDGTWTITGTVLDDNQVRITYTDGTTAWTTTDVCEEDPPPPMALPFRRND